MKPNEIQILHLSDLHFEGEVTRPVFEVLLRDIEDRLKDVERLVVVVTGDLISRANFGKNAINVERFFKRLKKVLPDECIESVEIVPGNHDFERPKNENRFNNGTYKPNLRKFKRLAQKVYCAMGVSSRGRCGVSHIEYCGGEICLVRVDTSLVLSKDAIRDEVREEIAHNKIVRCGKKEIEKIVDLRSKRINEDIEFQKKIIVGEYGRIASKSRSGRPLLTIAASHYPLSWLNETGHVKLRETLFEKGLDFVDIWLCGHLHDAQLYYTNDDGRQTTMLMSGIGRKENPQATQRYSIYSISPIRNVCSVQIRVFEGDEIAEGKCRNVTLPLSSKEVGAVIPMNRRENTAPMDCYVDRPTLALLKFVSGRMIEFDRKLKAVVAEYSKRKITAKNFGEVLRMFSSSMLCCFSPTDLKDEIEFPTFGFARSGCVPKWRVHFRRLQDLREGKCKRLGFDGDKYVAVCVSKGMRKPRLMKWKSLICAAFGHEKKTLISSANQGVCKQGTKWDEYLTAIPKISGNEIVAANGEKRPIIAYGISVSGDDYESSVLAFRTLYLLEYLEINEVVTQRLGEYLSGRKTDLCTCVRGLKC